MGWCRLEGTFGRDAKWKRLARELGVSRAQAAGHVACLYSWAAGNAPDGFVGDLSVEELEDECLWEGEPGALFAALRLSQIFVLEEASVGLVIHRFIERAESYKAAQRKRAERERKKAAELSQLPSQDGRVTVTTTVTPEREEREEKREKRERERVREEPPPPVSDSLLEVHASTIAVERAQRLCEVYHAEMSIKRGHAPVLVTPPMRFQHARLLLALAGGNDELAAKAVLAYVRSDHEWWKKKRWALHVLTDARDFEHAMQLAASDKSGRAVEAESTSEREKRERDARWSAMTPKERAAELMASAASLRRLTPGSPMADELEAKAKAEESRP